MADHFSIACDHARDIAATCYDYIGYVDSLGRRDIASQLEIGGLVEDVIRDANFDIDAVDDYTRRCEVAWNLFENRDRSLDLA